MLQALVGTIIFGMPATLCIRSKECEPYGVCVDSSSAADQIDGWH
jgi:hypothetical protein